MQPQRILYFLLFASTLFLNTFLKAKNIAPFLDITQFGYEQYQDIIINDVVVKPALGTRRACNKRYDIIKRYLDKYNRPFTMLDIGASQGYYSFKAAYNYDAVCVMIEGDNPAYPMVGRQLLDLCNANTELDNIILLNKKIVPNDLQRLSECEHFDVVLAMNIIHWFKDDWQKVIDAILNMGDIVIIETPPEEPITTEEHNALRKTIIDYITALKPFASYKVPRHTSDTFSTMYVIKKNGKYLKRKTWISRKILPENSHQVISTYKKKKLVKQVDWPPDCIKTSRWLPGINLITFKMYQGSYPTKVTIKESLSKLRNSDHNDWTINNMILQGNRLVLIDHNDPTHSPGGIGGGRICTPEVFQKHLEIIDIDDPREFANYFWSKLIH